MTGVKREKDSVEEEGKAPYRRVVSLAERLACGHFYILKRKPDTDRRRPCEACASGEPGPHLPEKEVARLTRIMEVLEKQLGISREEQSE